LEEHHFAEPGHKISKACLIERVAKLNGGFTLTTQKIIEMHANARSIKMSAKLSGFV